MSRLIKVIICLPIILVATNYSVSNISTSRQNAITKAVSICSPAVVGINVIENRVGVVNGYSGDLFYDYFFGPQRYYKQYQISGGGSGFLISSDGYILTNHHVAGNASKVIVTLTSGENYEADIVGADLASDICLLKIEGKNFPFLKFGDADDILVGEWTIAMGNPFGLFEYNAKPVVTVGVVSNIGISFIQKDGKDYRIYKDMVQTDAAISSGNSGGPLLNANGEVIGMNTVIFTTTKDASGSAGSIGIGFAVPVDRIKRVVDLLKKNGKINRNINVGITVSGLDEKIAKYYRLIKNEGIFIYQMDSRSAASTAGLEVGDIIEKINGRKVIKTDDLLLSIGDAVVGDKLTFEVLRDRKKLELVLTIPPSLPTRRR